MTPGYVEVILRTDDLLLLYPGKVLATFYFKIEISSFKKELSTFVLVGCIGAL